MSNIGILGSYLDEGPKGIHLRWNLPQCIKFDRLQAMDWEFKIYRKASSKKNYDAHSKKINYVNFSKIYKPVLRTLSIEHQQRKQQELLFSFNEPLIYLELILKDHLSLPYPRRHRIPMGRKIKPSQHKVDAYYRKIKVDSDSDAKKLTLQKVQFDTVLLTLDNCTVEDIDKIRYLTESDYCKSNCWEELSETTKPIDVNDNKYSDAIQERLNLVVNRYSEIYTPNDYVDKYKQIIIDILEYQTDSQEHICDDNIKINISNSVTDLRKMLHIAATDPNMARLLGLYYVDKSVEAKHLYDYKIVFLNQKERCDGEDSKSPSVCGLLLNAGGKTNELRKPTFHTEQLPGFSWKGSDPLARVGIYFKSEKWSRNEILPLFYDIKRGNELLTGKESGPVPVNIDKNGENKSLLLFTDKPLEMGKYAYSVRSIDIFGRVSAYTNTRTSGSRITLKDTLPPPVPKLLKSSIYHDTDVDTYTGTFSFEYGYQQHMQAPDASKICLYWREDSLTITETDTINAIKDNPDGSILITFQNLNEQDLSKFDGGTISLDSRRKETHSRIQRYQPVSNTIRQNISIIEVQGNSLIIKNEYYMVFQVGDICQLRSSKNNRSNWHKWKDIPIQSPVNSITPQELLEPECTINNFYTNATYGNCELCVNFNLLEPDLFKGYKINDYEIQFSTLGAVSNDKPYLQPRFGLIDNNPCNNIATMQNGSFTLTPNTSDEEDKKKYIVMGLKFDSSFTLDVMGGEVALIFNEENEDIQCSLGKKDDFIFRVLGYYVTDNNNPVILVRIPKEDINKIGTAIEQKKCSCFYYPPYIVTGQIKLYSEMSSNKKDPYWINRVESQVLQGFFAASTVDERKNESELSLPCEVSIVKPMDDSLIPRSPVPDVFNETKGSSTPPDSEGRSLVSLAILTSPSAVLRLEVARALDTTLIMNAKQKWLGGMDYEGDMMPVLPKIAGSINMNDQGKYIFGIDSFSTTRFNDDFNIDILKNSRVKVILKENIDECVNPSITPKTELFFKATKVGKVNHDEKKLELVLSGNSEEMEQVPRGADCEIQIAPNFSDLAKLDSFLTMLANDSSNNDAFSIVTKVPIAVTGNITSYIDDIPGIGSNRFFYKARYVDIADNHLKWSESSVPIYQLDTTAPKVPKNVKKSIYKEYVLLSWDVSDESGLWGYLINGSEYGREEQLIYQPLSFPLEQVIFSKRIMSNEEDIEISIIDITEPNKQLDIAYEYISKSEHNEVEEEVNYVLGIEFLEEQTKNLSITVTEKSSDQNTIVETFDRNRQAVFLESDSDKYKIYALKKVSYKNEYIVIKSKKQEV